MAKNIGIDLGTTNSCISYLEGRDALIVPNPEGARVIPSVIAMTRDKKRIFGNVAKRQMITNSKNSIWGIKRLMGRKFSNPEIKEFSKRVGYDIVEAGNEDVRVKLLDGLYSPEEISGMFLGYLKNIAENYLGEELGETVITVPAFFSDSQRQATKVAGEIAGLKVSRIINEPTAALLAYGQKIKKDGLYVVYDLGGGTFDISIVEINGDVYKVVSSLGDTFLGGSDFDSQICNWIFREVENETAIDLRDNKDIVQRVIQIAEKAKIELSFDHETMISIPYLHHFSEGTNYHFQKKLLRSQLESFTMDFIDRTIEMIKKSMADINVKPEKIERVILVGGQSRMPLIYQKISALFKKSPDIQINPEEVVAQGAALQSEIITGKVKDLLLLDVTSLSLGVETKGDTFTKLIDRNSTIPIKKSMMFTTITDNQTVVKIHVLQGERDTASGNRSLGFFNLVGIPPSLKGIPQIEVNFEIDANGIVRVSAQDKTTGLTQSMKVQPASGLSPEEIEKIIQDASEYAEKDKLELKINNVKLQLKEEWETIKFHYQRYIEKVTPHDGAEIDALIDRTAHALEGDDLELLELLLKKMKNYRIMINSILTAEISQ
ncbi:molecular chaperone DnaK [candidate division KSB1 bacterium]|nr:molecular chaperone DnaK [Candidatus Aminicenantes bacterium]RQW03587.1 MAG: molecular chaperone DnaK [candidate division KSB1 bacterium]